MNIRSTVVGFDRISPGMVGIEKGKRESFVQSPLPLPGFMSPFGVLPYNLLYLSPLLSGDPDVFEVI